MVCGNHHISAYVRAVVHDHYSNSRSALLYTVLPSAAAIYCIPTVHTVYTYYALYVVLLLVYW